MVTIETQDITHHNHRKQDIAMRIFKYLHELLQENSKPSKRKSTQTSEKKKFEQKHSISLKNILTRENIEHEFIIAIENNLNSISELNYTQLQKLKSFVLPNLKRGAFKSSEIYKLLKNEFQLPEETALQITRNQSRRMSGTLNRLRYTKMGVTRYIWRTMEDERVLGNPNGPYANYKPSHYAREGKIFSLNQPTVDGFPGEAMHCRCYAEPILDDLAN